MALNLGKNKDSLVEAYKKVVDDKDDTDWAVFGYEGQNPILKVVETGNGGIDEMAEELSSGKMMYAYCRVKDPNTGLSKYVLIHWTGESVPENLKLKFTTHLKDMKTFLKGIHVTVDARSEQDINEEDIVKKVAKSSGANYSFHKEQSKPVDSPAPVGTNYKRIIPTKEINLTNRDKFWSQAEKDEINRQNEEKKRAEAERSVLERERKDREAKETSEREKKISQHMKTVHEKKVAEKKANEQNKDLEKRKWEESQKDSFDDEEERRHRSDNLRKERAAEAQKLVSGTAGSARDFFKQKSVERPDVPAPRDPPAPRKLQHNFGNQQLREESSVARKQPIELPKEENQSAPSKPFRQPEPEPESPTPEADQSYNKAVESPASPTSAVEGGPQTRDLLRQGLPPRQDSDAEDDDQDWDEQPAEDFTFRENRVPSYHEDYAAETRHEETQSRRLSSAQYYAEDDDDQQQTQQSNGESVVTADQGLCARAIYDYQAADDTEISFDPEDIITNIEQIDEGWWQGYGPDGSYGMFPANYVEMM